MNVAFKDFAPAVESRGFFKTTYEPLKECLQRANEWIQAAQPEVINVETVVLPNLWDRSGEGSEDPEIRTSGDMMSTWHQFIRVWYKV